MALPYDLQLHGRLPPWHRGHQGDPGSQACADHAPLLTQPPGARRGAVHRDGGERPLAATRFEPGAPVPGPKTFPAFTGQVDYARSPSM
ncbi:hypothetical protein SGPA1_12345 [Streptomyces misionensis JCM 4497]